MGRRRRATFFPLVCLVVCLVFSPALAGGPAAEDRLLAVRAAKLYTAAGPAVEAGVLIVRGKLIEAVLSAQEPLPAGAEVIELGDAVLVPGFVNPLTSISERSYRSAAPSIPSSSAGAPRDARFLVATASVKPEETIYRRLGRSGYTTFGWLPDTGGFIAGQASVIRPRSGREKMAADLTLKDSAYLLVGFEMGTRWREVVEAELRKAAEAVQKEGEGRKKAEEAKADDKKSEGKKADEKKAEEKPSPKDAEKKDEKKAAEQPPGPAPTGPPRPPPPPDPLVRAFKGETPMFLRVRSPAAFDHLFRIIDGLAVKPSFVLVAPPLAPETIEKLARRKDRIQGVILEPRPETFWETSILVNSARLFLERGFEVALVPASDSLEGHEIMPLRLAEMVRSGMRPADAIRAVTAAPARFLGLEGKVGVLAKGAFASFAAYKGEPLSGTARLVKVFVDGVEIFADDPASERISGEAVR